VIAVRTEDDIHAAGEGDPNRPRPDRVTENGPGMPRPDDDVDFADEHSDLTVADDPEGGPERRPEDDSPRGLAGQD